MEIAIRLGYIDEESIVEIDKKMIRVDKMVTGLIYSLKKKA